MKESEADRGTLLKALVLSFQLCCSLTTALKKFTEPAGAGWDDLADELARAMVNGTAPSVSGPVSVLLEARTRCASAASTLRDLIADEERGNFDVPTILARVAESLEAEAQA